VEILLREKGDAEVTGFHLQQAVEKYLKGYLLSQGWELQRIHNLEALLNEAIRFAPGLEGFRELCEEATSTQRRRDAKKNKYQVNISQSNVQMSSITEAPLKNLCVSALEIALFAGES